MPIAPNKSGRNLLLQQIPVRLRRLMREGFAEFLISMALASLSAILLDVYIRDKLALDQAIRDETVKVVGGREEPNDSAKELGLIATALAKVNSEPDPAGWVCPNATPNCPTFEKMVGNFVQAADPDVIEASTRHLNKGEWEQEDGEILNLLPSREQNPENLSWPELGEGPFCLDNRDHTFLMVPAQMTRLTAPHFSPRIAAAADVSKALFRHLPEFRAKQEYADLMPSLVQAYFISPDSLLRVWNQAHGDLCNRFSKTRLWASKNYFVQFWEGERTNQFSTKAYIDYGGNGLVRTSCHVVELPRDNGVQDLAKYPRGHFLGIFCMDFKLADLQVDLMRQQLFFEIADVLFPIEGKSLEQLTVKLVPPSKPLKPGADEDKTGPQNAATPQPLLTASMAARPGSTHKPGPRVSTPNEVALQRAIEMQASTLNVSEVKGRLKDQLQSVDELKRVSGVQRITYGTDKEAFLLPLGVSGNQFEALLFYPRSPRLPLLDDVWGILGLLCAGGAVVSLIAGGHFHSQLIELREHMSLLRNLQVGVLKVKVGNEITECNDRAEELCERKLPKPGVKLDPPVNFADIFDLFVQGDGVNYNSISMKHIEKMRESGQASAYYARLRKGSGEKWLFVRATPIMEPERVSVPKRRFLFRRATIWHMTRQGSFATITEACKERVDTLNERFGRGKLAT